MKKAVYFLLMSLFLVGFVACGGEDGEEANEADLEELAEDVSEEIVHEDNTGEAIVNEATNFKGSWTMSGDSGDETYTFNDDNTLVVEASPADGEGFTRNATWAEDEIGVLTLKFDDMDENQVVHYVIEGDNLMLTFNKGADYELTQTFVRQ